MRIYLVRHGETIWNTEGRIQGWKNSNLTEKGIEDAKALGKYLRDVDFQCAFTSPFQRAIDTTKFILGDKNIVIDYTALFKLMDQDIDKLLVNITYSNINNIISLGE